MGKDRELFLRASNMLGRSAARLEHHQRILAPLMTLDRARVESLNESLGCIETSKALAGPLHLRSRLSYGYPSRPDLQAEAINDARNAIPDLLALLPRMRGYVVQSGLIAADDLPPHPPTA